ncbi:MAG: glycosyltransferase family 2 protein [Christensenella sp.]
MENTVNECDMEEEILSLKKECENKLNNMEREALKKEYMLKCSYTNKERENKKSADVKLLAQAQVINELVQRCQDYAATIDEIKSSRSWRITKPLRAARKNKQNTATAFNAEEQAYTVSPMQQFAKEPYTAEQIEAFRKTKFAYEPKISILVPLYNTKEGFLRDMTVSVLNQTYSNWELCLADGSDEEHAYVGEIAKEYAATDARVVYKKLERNDGISGNTNACIKMATGEYAGLLDHDDLLHEAVLSAYVQEINDKKADFIYCDETTFKDTPKDAYFPHFKPDFAIDNLRANNYICHFSMFAKKLIDEVGGFRSEYDGSQDYDLVLRLTERAECIVHIPKILYYWRAHEGSVALQADQKPYAFIAAKKAVKAHMERVGLEGDVTDAQCPGVCRPVYKLKDKPLVSIIIPNKDKKYLTKCIESIMFASTYDNVEIVIVENNSEDPNTFLYYEKLQRLFNNVKIVVCNGDGIFNYSRLNNAGIGGASGEYLLFLNNDIQVITPDWIEQMLMYAQREDVGAVGAKLYFDDDTVQHAGVCLGLGGVGAHWHRGVSKSAYGYMGRLCYAQDVSAVTAACVMVRSSVVKQVGGFNEQLAVEYNDVDFCMRIRAAGYLIVFTPFAELYHFESKTRKVYTDPAKDAQHLAEEKLFFELWGGELKDPYYNAQLPLDVDAFACAL